MNIVINTLQVIFWFIVILTPLVIVHEFGHLLISRLFGVKIPEFGVGLPLTKHRLMKKYRGIKWSVYPWLLGGFVRIFGDHDAIDEAYHSYKSKPENVDEIRKEYLANRKTELVTNREVPDFLEFNSLEYDEDWQWFEAQIAENEKLLNKEYDDKSFESSMHKQRFESKINTLETLIDWEFDARILAKDIKRANRDTFFAKNWIQQTLIIFGGIIFNFTFAFIVFLIIFGTTGSIPSAYSSLGTPIFAEQIRSFEQQGKVERLSEGLYVQGLVPGNGLAERSGVRAGYELLTIEDRDLRNLSSLNDFKAILNEQKGKQFRLEIKDTGGNKQILTVDTASVTGDVILGVGIGYRVKRTAENPLQVVGLAWNETLITTQATVDGLGKLVQALLPNAQDRSVLGAVSGPVGIGAISGEIFGSFGIIGLLYVLASISIALGIFNALPVPALDGGRFVIITINKVFGKSNRKIEAAAISITFLLLIGLSLIVTGNDIWRFIVQR